MLRYRDKQRETTQHSIYKMKGMYMLIEKKYIEREILKTR